MCYVGTYPNESAVSQRSDDSYWIHGISDFLLLQTH